MNNLLADIIIAPNGGFSGLGTGPLAKPAGDGTGTLTNIISAAIGLMTIIAIIWFIFIFISGAIGIMSAGADKNALESAKKRITTGLIGLVVVIVAVFIFDLIGFLLGFGTGSLLNIQGLFQLLKI